MIKQHVRRRCLRSHLILNFCLILGFQLLQWYSAGHTDDLRSGLLFASESWPDAPLIGLGFSLGANILTRYLGEEGPRSRLRAGIVLACVSNSGCHKKSQISSPIYSHGTRKSTVIGELDDQ